MTLAVATPAGAADLTLTVPMKPLNSSQQTGWAVLTPVADGVRISIKLDHASGTLEPTHLHLGTCGKIVRTVEYALLDTQDGTSSTVIPGVTIDELKSKHYAINVHKSLKEIDHYVSCGNIN